MASQVRGGGAVFLGAFVYYLQAFLFNGLARAWVEINLAERFEISFCSLLPPIMIFRVYLAQRLETSQSIGDKCREGLILVLSGG